MRPKLRELADRASRNQLAGFARRRGWFTKSDELLRSVWFVEMFRDGGTLTFDIVFDLGIPGISTSSSKSQEWVVRAYGNRLHKRFGDRRVKLTFGAHHSDELVSDAAIAVIDLGCRDFLLRYSDPEQLYAMVRESALRFLRAGEAEDDFSRLELEPFNVFPRLEIAAVYATFLGHTSDSESLTQEAIQFAEKKGIDYGIPRIRESVQHATELRHHGQSSATGK